MTNLNNIYDLFTKEQRKIVKVLDLKIRKKPEQLCGLRIVKTKNQYKASNVVFDANTMEAYSYGWWKFVSIINGRVIFNDFSYSKSTVQHQSKIVNLLHILNIKIDHFVLCPRGLQDLNSGIEYSEIRIEQLQHDINKPKSHKAKNMQKLEEINKYIKHIEVLKTLIKSN